MLKQRVITYENYLIKTLFYFEKNKLTKRVDYDEKGRIVRLIEEISFIKIRKRKLTEFFGLL